MRRIIQYISTFIQNSYLMGFFLRGIYQGKLKYFCAPSLNCWSCPAAVFACPIGVIQHMVAYGRYYVSFYTLGLLMAIGSVAGRIVCGWACPFGLLQDLMFKIKTRKFSLPRWASKIKYAVLLLLVIIIPYFTKEAWFSMLCPAGTIEAGIPLVLLDVELRQFVGTLFWVKILILAVFLIWMVYVKRPFCRTSCPLGAIYSLFNKISFFQLSVDHDKCTKCNICLKACPVDIKVYEEAASTECIRCLDCKKTCPQKAINF